MSYLRIHNENFLVITQILQLFIGPGPGDGEIFTDPDELFQFVIKVDDPNAGQYSFECSICQKRFIRRMAVRNHAESIHFPNMFRYTCQHCGKEMKSRSSLNYHITTEHNKKNKI